MYEIGRKVIIFESYFNKIIVSFNNKDIISLLGFCATNVRFQKMFLPDVAVDWMTSSRYIWSWVQNLARRPAILVDIFCGFTQYLQPSVVMVLMPQILLWWLQLYSLQLIFTNELTIQPYALWAADSVVKYPQINKYN
jgi:hypothetical protein